MEDFLGCEVLMNTSLKASDHGVPRAPGMKYKHYAPKAEMVLVLGEDQEKVVNYINKLAREQKEKGKKIGKQQDMKSSVFKEGEYFEENNNGKYE